MENESKTPTLEEVRARRKAIAEEDRILASIEQNLVSIAKMWDTLQQCIVLNIQHPETVTPSLISAAMPLLPVETTKGPKTLTKNQAIIEALDAPRELWQTANQIQEYVSRRTGKDVPMSSISPALTQLKNDRTIVRDDKFVALTLRYEASGNTNEAPTEPTESASKPETVGTANTDMFS